MADWFEADDPWYLEAIRAESEFWSSRHTVESRARTPRNHPVLAAYANEVVSGDPAVPWPDHLRRTRGTFARGLSLGGGLGPVEARLLESGAVGDLTIVEIAAGAVERGRAEIERRGLGPRVRYVDGDLNFFEPPGAAYDLVLANAVLHHIANLERLLDAVRGCLAPGGLLVVFDYVGEPKFQWSDRRRAVVEALLALAPPGLSRPGPVRPPSLSAVQRDTPFEAIRPEAVLPALHARFRTVAEWPSFGVLQPFLTLLRWDDRGLWEESGGPGTRYLRALCAVDRIAAAAGDPPPSNVLGWYAHAGPGAGEAPAAPAARPTAPPALPADPLDRTFSRRLLRRVVERYASDIGLGHLLAAKLRRALGRPPRDFGRGSDPGGGHAH